MCCCHIPPLLSCAMSQHGTRLSWLWPVIKTGFRQQMSYKRAMAVGAIASIGFAVVRLMVLHSLYQGHETIGGLTYEQVVSWAVFAGLLFALVWAPWAHEFPEAIRQGAVVGDLLRPINPFCLHLANHGGRILALLLIRIVPVVILAAVVLPLPSPNGFSGWTYFACSLFLLVIGSLAYMYMLGTTAFFTADYHVWLAFAFYIVQLIGGMYVPLEFIPGLAGDIIRWGPGMAFMPGPTRVINGIEPVQTLCIQLGWTLVFSVAAYVGLHLGRKRLVSFGG